MWFTIQAFNKLTAENFENDVERSTSENFAERLKQTNLVNKTNFDNKPRDLIWKLPQIALSI